MTSVDVNSSSSSAALIAVLDAVEDVFAAAGTEEVTMGRIALAAGMEVEAIEARLPDMGALLEAAYDRRVRAVNEEREIGLAHLPSPDLHSVLCVLFRPSMGSGRGARAFYLLSARLLCGQAHDHDLLASRCDPVARLFIEAIRLSVPGLSHAAAAKSYMLSIGVMCEATRRMGRMERLMELEAPESVTASIEDAARFAAGGIRAMARMPAQDDF
jgi:AcrR family transcriptional regulator